MSWYLAQQMWSMKAQESMLICAISPGSRLLTNNIKFEVDETQVK